MDGYWLSRKDRLEKQGGVLPFMGKSRDTEQSCAWVYNEPAESLWVRIRG